jgi:hypothetical protein
MATITKEKVNSKSNRLLSRKVAMAQNSSKRIPTLGCVETSQTSQQKVANVVGVKLCSISWIVNLLLDLCCGLLMHFREKRPKATNRPLGRPFAEELILGVKSHPAVSIQ